MTRARTVILSLTVALLASLAVHAYRLAHAAEAVAPSPSPTLLQPEFRPVGTRDPCIACTLGGLGLDDDQRRRLTEVASRTQTLEAALDREIAVKVRALQVELRREPSDEGRVAGLVSEISHLREERLGVRVRAILEVKQTLTSDQLSRLASALTAGDQTEGEQR